MRRAGFILLILASLPAACGGAGGDAPAPPHGLLPLPNDSAHSNIYVQKATATADTGLVFPGFTCLTPQTVRSESANATITQSITANQTFNGRGNLTAVTSSVALQGCSDGKEPLVETDYFTTEAAAGGATSVVLVGAAVTSSDVAGTSSYSVSYANGGLIVAQTPFKSGRTWSSPATRTVTSNSETLDVHGEGSYNDQIVRLNGTWPYESITTVENSDASATQTTVAGANASAPSYSRALSAPSNHTVIVSTSGTPPIPPDWPTPTPCPTPGATPCPNSTSTPSANYAWYPYVPSPSHPLETIVSSDKGSVSLPSGCSVPHAFPTQAELIETVDTSLDIWTGVSTTTTDAYIDAQHGLLCATATVQQAFFVLGPTSADTTPVASATLTFTDSLQRQGGAAAVFAAPALARYLTLWR